MALSNTRKLVGGTQITVDKPTYHCPSCSFHEFLGSNSDGGECSECGELLNSSHRVDQTLGIECGNCSCTVPADNENRSISSELPIFVCPRCEGNPIVGVLVEGELVSPVDVLRTSFLSIDLDSSDEIVDGVFVSEADSRREICAAQALNSEAKRYDSAFTGYSIDSDDTHVLMVFTDDLAIGYVTWTVEMCADDVSRPILQQMFLLEDYWRQGIGEALTRYVVRELPCSGESVWLNSPNEYMMDVLDRLDLVGVDEDNGLVVNENLIGITGTSKGGVNEYVKDKLR